MSRPALVLGVACLLAFLSACRAAERPYAPTWESLQKHGNPEWFRDAKFGIYFHWGVYSVPAYGNEWYSRNMYRKGSGANKHHVEKYGPVSKFGYKDFIPSFTAEDVRFTSRGKVLYAVLLGWPGEEAAIKTLARSCPLVGGTVSAASPASMPLS